MVELNLYKVAALLIGAVIALAIDASMGIEWKSYPLWKQLVHKVTYMVWGGILMLL